MERMLKAPTGTAGGGCGRPVLISVVPPMSTLAATSLGADSLPTTILMLSAPQCG